MANYKYDTVVSRSEADALKEMIFKRARERAAALNTDTQESYTTSARNDIMDLARDSFVASKNPFSVNNEVKQEPVKAEEPAKQPEIGFAQRSVEEIKAQINYRNKAANSELAAKQAEENMQDARESLSKKTSFMGALNFLNAQASISLVNKEGNRFKAIA